MVERRRRGQKQPKLLGSHQKCWLWGRNAVLETLSAGKWPALELALAADLPAGELKRAQTLAERRGIPVSIEPAEALQRRCRSPEHQGYVAKMPPFPYDDADSLLRNRPQRPLYVVLDSIQDPHNFGAIVRSAEVMAFDAVFIAETGQVGVTSAVARSSAGAVNHVPIARAGDLPGLARRLKQLDVRLVGASEKAEINIIDCDLTRPVAIVIGSEATGISPELADLCDETARIPQYGRVGSLNAAVSAGILFYEARRQRAAQDETAGR